MQNALKFARKSCHMPTILAMETNDMHLCIQWVSNAFETENISKKTSHSSMQRSLQLAALPLTRILRTRMVAR